MEAIDVNRVGFGTRFSFGLALAAAAMGTLAAPADDARALLRQGKPAEAYEAVAGHPELLGIAEFDFVYGVAAVDAGHAAEGVLALERFLLAFPADQQARLELARGYFILGEDARAREEFEAVMALKPPAVVQANIQRHLDAIRLRESRYTTTARGYVEAGMGLDSNVNGGVSSATINLPVLGAVQVGAAGQRQGDWAHLLGAGLQVTHPIEAGVMAFGGIDWERKELRLRDAFDTEAVTLNGGGSWLIGDHQWRATASHSTLLVDRTRYRDVAAIGGEWQRQISELQTVSLGLQYAQLRHTGANQVRDTDLTGITAGFRQALAIDWQPLLSGSITVADDASRRQRGDLARMLYSARLGVSLSPVPRWGLSAGFTYQESRYKDADVLLATRRTDSFGSLDLAATYLIDRNWSVRAEASLTQNASNLALYEYRRDAIGVKLRYEFK